MGFNIDPYQIKEPIMKKALKVVTSRTGTSELIVNSNGSARRFTKKGAFSFLRKHGDKTKVQVTDAGDGWVAVIEGGN